MADTTPRISDPARRRLLQGLLPAGACLCLGRANLLAAALGGQEEAPADVHKFAADSGMSFEAVFRFAFQSYYIPCLQKLAEEIGREAFLEMVKRVSSEAAAERQREWARTLPKTDFETYVSIGKQRKNRFVQHVLTDEVVEERPDFLRTKITECLWAKIFREAGAEDLGYAAICHPDFAMARAFNPKIRLERPTTLMQGDECCDFRYIWEG